MTPGTEHLFDSDRESIYSLSPPSPNPLAGRRAGRRAPPTAEVSGSFGAGTHSLTRPRIPVYRPVRDHIKTVESDVRVAKTDGLK